MTEPQGPEPAGSRAADPDVARRLERTQLALTGGSPGAGRQTFAIRQIMKLIDKSPRMHDIAAKGRKRALRAKGKAARGRRAFGDWRTSRPLPLRDPAESPLAEEYRNLINDRQPPDGTARSIAFCVSSTDTASGRGDLYVAAGLARALRRRGWRTALFPKSAWGLIPEGTDVVVAMVATTDPEELPESALRVAWVRNAIDVWTHHPKRTQYDLWLAISEIVRAQLAQAVGPAPIEIMAIGVDEELFGPPASPAARSGVVSTGNDFGNERDSLRYLATRRPAAPLVLFGARGRGAKRSRSLNKFEAGLIDFFRLPSVYASAAVVLDDQVAVTRGVGSPNSRIYEVLAAGGLPITNTALALRGTGLEAIPVFADRATFFALLEQHAGFGPRTQALAARLREVVLDRHTYAHRAATFEGAVDSAPAPGATRLARRLSFFPDFTAGNPYLDMLYSRAVSNGWVAVPGPNPAFTPPSALPGRHRVFHVHWTQTFFVDLTSEQAAALRVRQIADRLRMFRREGGQVVWTVHNINPHEVRYPEADRVLQAVLAEQADLVHVMCDTSAAAVPSLADVPSERLVVIPHASYLGCYPDAVSQPAARRRLGLPADSPIAALVGGFRPYKGIDTLVRALDAPQVAALGVEALIAGRPGKAGEMPGLKKMVAAHPRVHARLEFVPPEQLQLYFKAADVAVFPYRRTLNSGAVLAALTFGTPVIAPREGCLPDVINGSYGILYDQDDPDGFTTALSQIDMLRTPEARRAARARAEAFTARDMSDAFFAALNGRVESAGFPVAGGADERS